MQPPTPPIDRASFPHPWGLEGSLDDPGIQLLLIVIGVLLVVAMAAVGVLSVTGMLKADLRSELIKRVLAWVAMAPICLVPVLLGKLPTVLLVTLISLACYREFSRATGLFRDAVMSVLVILSILALNFAALDNWYNMFVAVPAFAVVAMTTAGIARDQPKGYVQRLGLATMSLLLFGLSLAHISFMANDPEYRRPMILLMLSVALNDVFAYCVGKSVGGPKLAPNTSPAKTVSGAVGAIVLTTLTTWAIGAHVLRSDLHRAPHLIAMGVTISVCGILGDLAISSVKRDVGIKDMGAIIPGHGGVLDRCNSLLLAAPAIFYYIKYFHGFGIGQPERIFTGP